MLRNVEADKADTLSKAADLGKFKYEHTWPDWEVKVGSYLSTTPGVNIIPLPYAVRSQAAYGRTTYFQG